MKTLTYLPQKITAEEIDSAVEFDSPFLVNEDGTVELSGNHGPDEVYGGLYGDGSLMISDGWETWSDGYTGQYGYNGPVLHDSEFLGGGIAHDLLEEPGEYCLCFVTYMCDDMCEDLWEEGEESCGDIHTEGWVVLKAI